MESTLFPGEFSMKASDIIIGLALIILGFLFLSENFGYLDFDFQEVWPVIFLVAGGGFWAGYFQNRRNYGLLMPGTILIVYGLMFWYCASEGWYNMQYIWPGFLIGPGLGFIMLYIFGEREKGLLIPAGILIGLGVIFLLSFSNLADYWPIILIGAGIYLIYKHYKGRNTVNASGDKTD